MIRIVIYQLSMQWYIRYDVIEVVMTVVVWYLDTARNKTAFCVLVEILLKKKKNKTHMILWFRHIRPFHHRTLTDGKKAWCFILIFSIDVFIWKEAIVSFSDFDISNVLMNTRLDWVVAWVLDDWQRLKHSRQIATEQSIGLRPLHCSSYCIWSFQPLNVTEHTQDLLQANTCWRTHTYFN